MKSKKNSAIPLKEYVDGISSGDRMLLSKAITLIESNNPVHFKLSQQIVNKCMQNPTRSIRLGITGIPGVGKSTFIEALGTYLIENYKKKIAVLAVDPSSESSHGSIMGDKVRMVNLSNNQNAFVRPTPSSGFLGGVARKTRETIILCEAAGFDTIMIETMGVGQSEFKVSSMVDYFLLLLMAGAGDEIQGIKRGIMEIADGFVINKADGNKKQGASIAKKEIENSIKLLPVKDSGWTPSVFTCSSTLNEGLDDIWDDISNFHSAGIENGYFDNRRKTQLKQWMKETILFKLEQNFINNKKIQNMMKEIESDVVNEKLSPYSAADKLLKTYFNN